MPTAQKKKTVYQRHDVRLNIRSVTIVRELRCKIPLRSLQEADTRRTAADVLFASITLVKGAHVTRKVITPT